MDFEPYFKVHSSVHPKSIILGQMTIPTQHDLSCGCQFIDLLKFETRPSFLLNFEKGNRHAISDMSRIER